LAPWAQSRAPPTVTGRSPRQEPRCRSCRHPDERRPVLTTLRLAMRTA
jgi:hypothetical protein